MIEYIGNVKMNYSYYSGDDQYTDGEIEDELLEIVKSKPDLAQVLKEDDRWPILYHLSPTRHNLLEWFPFKPDGEVLEIGAGCGAVTGLLCDKTKEVTCIELSKRRALINAHRHTECDKLEIVVGNLNDIKLNKKYDYVTLIGVLEYAALYTETDSPYLSFLSNIKKYLKEDGVLIVAIENKLGLKYWSGSKEDHTGEFFDSIQNYPSNKKIATFSRKELIDMFHEVGFSKTDFYYPYPDYKLPVQIYSDEWLPGLGDIRSRDYNFDQSKLALFDEESVLNNLIQNQLFPQFSNSFLVFCSD